MVQEVFSCSPERQQKEAARGFWHCSGCTYQDLREQSARFVNQLDVFGIAIGGALGKDKKEMSRIISWVQKVADPERPRHLLGIGDLDVLEKIIKQGIDLFDCALPTRVARHGQAFTNRGAINIKSSRYRHVLRPIQRGCSCPTCQSYNLSQLNFLFRAKEQLAGKLLTMHNLFFLGDKLEKIRLKISIKQF